MLAFIALIQHNTGGLSHSNQTRRRKRHPNWKERSTLSLFANDLKLYIEIPKDSNRKLLELTKEFSKVAGYKINIQKSGAFLYTNNKLSERETKRTIPFTTASKKSGT